MLDMPMGDALIWVVRTHGLTIVHISSPSLPATLTSIKNAVPEGADVVLVSATVHTLTPRYAERIVEELRPRLVIPHHFESFFVPLKENLDDKDRADGESFVKRIRDLGVKAQMPQPFVEVIVSDLLLPARIHP
ncbi:MAG: MBL fold metallo-hydrolase [Deltaproteobacteria bacterium]|nr:MBL fold metallo-hydrolase [Deltaproteobacteria bacterium]